MIIYNVTVNIDHDVHDVWLKWMCEIHIPEVMETGMFLDSKMSKILAHEEGGLSYSIQYLMKDHATFEKYQTEFSPKLQEKHNKRFQGKFAAFRTLMEVVHHEVNTD